MKTLWEIYSSKFYATDVEGNATNEFRYIRADTTMHPNKCL